ncbi:magnesium transporter NIPA1 [Gouania willdenowi]|uniref:Magnesium transporter n=1 Tax=Gouania willdenowi TaxID=441366 RepID=A0A8C5EQ79_GOUWI|nr:magnesium transporter NIPA1 [Gouania willdenowi]
MEMDPELEARASLTAGIVTAVVSSFINGLTFVLQKKGILRSRHRGGSHLTDVVWWSGTLCMIIGQIGNFFAYNMAPAVIVTPLGALGVLFGAVLASWILEERLNIVGKLGCVLCCCGSVLLIVHAPKAEATSILELEERLLDPVFATYLLFVLLLLLTLIVWVAPAHGHTNIMVYITICSLFGNFTVPSSKGLGLLAPEALGGGSSSSRALTLFLFLLMILTVSVLSQFFFINKALQHFSSNIFEAIYYVMFTSCVILSSALLFKECTTLTVSDGLTMLCALTTVCVGVVLLRISQEVWKEKEDQKKTE